MRDDALSRDRLDRRGRYPEGCIQAGGQDRVRTLNAAAIRTVSVSQEARRQSSLYPWPMTSLRRTRFNWQQYEGRNGLLPKQAIQSGRLMGCSEKALKAA